MITLRNFLLATLVCSLVTFTAQADEVYQSEDSCMECGSAYTENGNVAHWSAYIPITILVAAAIFFGIADKKHENCNSYSDPYDGLGNLKGRRKHNQRGSYCHQ